MTSPADTAPRYIADDYGLCGSVDRAIEDLAAAGGLTGASVIATHAQAERVERLARHSRLEIGLHLNLTEGWPVGDARDLSGLVDDDGRLLPMSRLVLRSLTRRLAPAELVNEIAAQWDFVRRHAGRVDYIDGHEHLHMLPVVYAALVRVTSWPKRSTPRLRSGRSADAGTNVRSLLTDACMQLNARLYPDPPFTISADLRDYAKFDGNAQESCEVMMHVAHPQHAAPELDRTSYSYADRVAQFERRMTEVGGGQT